MFLLFVFLKVAEVLVRLRVASSASVLMDKKTTMTEKRKRRKAMLQAACQTTMKRPAISEYLDVGS